MPMAREPGSGVGPTRDSDDEEDALQGRARITATWWSFDDIKAEEERSCRVERVREAVPTRDDGRTRWPRALEAFALAGRAPARRGRCACDALHLRADLRRRTPRGPLTHACASVEAAGRGRGRRSAP